LESRDVESLLKIIKKDYTPEVYSELMSGIKSPKRSKLKQTEFPFTILSYNPTIPKSIVKALQTTRSKKLLKEMTSLIIGGGDFLTNYAQSVGIQTGLKVPNEEALKMLRFRIAQPDKGLEHWFGYTGFEKYGGIPKSQQIL
jgi:hypothetical protein